MKSLLRSRRFDRVAALAAGLVAVGWGARLDAAGLTYTTWTLSGATFVDGGKVTGSATYVSNGNWTWDFTSTPNDQWGFHWTNQSNEFENDDGSRVEFITTDYVHQLQLYVLHGSTPAQFVPYQADTFDLGSPSYSGSLEVGSGGGGRGIISGTLMGVTTTVPPHTGPDITTDKAYWTETELLNGDVNPNFKGGTLRMDQQTTLDNGFIVADGGGTIDQAGFVTLLSGGAISGTGSLRFTDSMAATNAARVGSILLYEPIASTGTATTIDSGAYIRADGTSNLHGSLPTNTNLVLNGGIKFAYSQTLASVAGSDPTATLDLGTSSQLTINGATSSTYAGGFAGSSLATVELASPAHLTLTGASPFTGYFFVDSGASLTLSGAGSLANAASLYLGGSLDVSGATNGATVQSFAGVGNVALGARTFTLSMSSNLSNSVYNGTMSGTGGVTVTMGRLTFNTNQTYTGTSTVNAGATLTAGAALGSGSSIVDSGTVNLGAVPIFSEPGSAGPQASSGLIVRTFNAITVNNGGKLIVVAATAAANRNVVVTGQLNVAGATNAWQGLVDLTNNDLIVRNASAATIGNQIKQAYHNGDWAGTAGIDSSAAKAANGTMALGYATMNGTFDGQTVSSADVVVAYALNGDADLDGSVGFADLLALARNYGLSSGVLWTSGDFNYDGSVGFADLLVLARNYGHALSASDAAAASVAGGPGFVADWTLAQSLVPEPTAAVAFVAAAAVACSRRARIRA